MKKKPDADDDNSKDNYSEVDNNEAFVINRETMLDGTTRDIQSLTYTFTPEESKIPMISEPSQNISPFQHFSMGK